MDIFQVTKQFLEGIRNPATKGASIKKFEETMILDKTIPADELRDAFQLLLADVHEEEDQNVKAQIFSVLGTILDNRDVEEYVDWDEVKRQLPLLSENVLLVALEMFYSRLLLSDIFMFTAYLKHPNLTIRMNALNIICETVIFSSGRDSAVIARLRTKQYDLLLIDINNPERRKKISEAELEERFSIICNNTMIYIQYWLDPTFRRVIDRKREIG